MRLILMSLLIAAFLTACGGADQAARGVADEEPTRTAEPGTSPPPVTRSNSANPQVRRGCGLLWLCRSTNCNFWAALPRPESPPGVFSKTSSVIEFQAPQPSQRPDHLAATAPQSWQT